MEHTFEELREKTVAQLREIAKGIEHDALRGYSTMHKEQLVQALCKALGFEAHERHAVVGVDKSQIKAQIRKLKTDRDTALKARNPKKLKVIRRNIRLLKRKIRKATVQLPAAQESPATEKPPAAKEAPGAKKPAEEKAAEEKPVEEKLKAAEAPAAEKQPVAEQPPASEEAPAAEKPQASKKSKATRKPKATEKPEAPEKSPSSEENEG
jgi:hypothetical protein